MEKRGLTVLIVIILLVIGGYFLFSDAEITGRATTDSQVGNLSASIQTLIACTWSDVSLSVSFGSNLDPGTNDLNATNNTNNNAGADNNTYYNVTVDTLSNQIANITIRGDHLISGANTIGVGNVSWASNSTAANGTNMVAASSNELLIAYDDTNQVAGDEAIGSTVYYRLWLDVPSGQVAGTYAGNYTMQCEAAL